MRKEVRFPEMEGIPNWDPGASCWSSLNQRSFSMFDRFPCLIASLKFRAMFRAYPWSGYDHLLFDTIVVKPLGEEKEHHVNGTWLAS